MRISETVRDVGGHSNRRLSHLIFAIVVGAAGWLVYLAVVRIANRYFWDVINAGPRSVVTELSITAVPVFLAATIAVAWHRAGGWWQQWAALVCGITLCILVKSYWEGHLWLAKSILSGGVFLTCTTTTLIASYVANRWFSSSAAAA